MNYDPRGFGMRITNMRKELGKTQQEMADILHTSLDNYRGIEKGRRNPSLDLLVVLSSAFNVTLDCLVLGRTILTDNQRIQQELEDIMGRINRLKNSIYPPTVTNLHGTVTTRHSETALKSATIKSQSGKTEHLENQTSQCTHTAPSDQEPPGEFPAGGRHPLGL